MQKITDYKKDDKVKISYMNCRQNLKCRLEELGLYDGALVKIIKNDDFGPLIIKIFNSQFALGRGEAQKIYGEQV